MTAPTVVRWHTGTVTRTLVAVAVGGVVGALARYGLSVLWPTPFGAFGWTTLAVNASGCLLIGVLMGRLDRVSAPAWVRPALGVGVLGGYTTFSGYAAEALATGQRHGPPLAIAYLAATLVTAIVAVWLGTALAGRPR